MGITKELFDALSEIVAEQDARPTEQGQGYPDTAGMVLARDAIAKVEREARKLHIKEGVDRALEAYVSANHGFFEVADENLVPDFLQFALDTRTWEEEPEKEI